MYISLSTPRYSMSLLLDGFDKFSERMGPLVDTILLGKNISVNQPDVEVLAMTLKDIPLNGDKFNEMSAGKGWVSAAFSVLMVGGPGFSSVPYTANKKKGDRESESKSVYEIDDDGNTKFYTFEKGKTNKDKGVRVSSSNGEESDGKEAVLVDRTAVLHPGCMLSTFMREEDFLVGPQGGDSKMFILGERFKEAAVLPANTLVYIQLASSNIEQAKKGSILKLRRIKTADHIGHVVQRCFDQMPHDERQLERVQDKTKSHESLSRMAYMGNVKVFAVMPSPTAFAVPDESAYVISEFSEQMCDVMLSAKVLCASLGSSDVAVCLKTLNVALGCGAVRCLVRSSMSGGVVMGSDSAYEVALLEIDVNTLFSLHTFKAFQDWPGNDNSNYMETAVLANGDVLWTCPTTSIMTHENKMEGVVFRLGAFKLETTSQSLTGTDHVFDERRFLGHGGVGEYLPLDIYLVAGKRSIAAVAGQLDAMQEGAARLVTRLELRTENRSGSVAKKRRRVDLTI